MLNSVHSKMYTRANIIRMVHMLISYIYTIHCIINNMYLFSRLELLNLNYYYFLIIIKYQKRFSTYIIVKLYYCTNNCSTLLH